MIKEFKGINISTKDPAELVEFYNEKLGIPILDEGFGNYDGAELGFDRDAPVIYIWDERKWGKSNEGSVNLVFGCDNLDTTYEELKSSGVELDPPITAEWGGKELMVFDPEGNKVLLL